MKVTSASVRRIVLEDDRVTGEGRASPRLIFISCSRLACQDQTACFPCVPPDNNTAAYLAITCGDAPSPRDPGFYRQMVAAESAKFPFVGGEQANITPCAFWPFRPGSPVSLTGDALGVLVVDSDGDPATPYSGSQLIHAAIPGSRLITLHASVHVPYPGYGSACVNDAVNSYLATGQLPPADLQCG